MSPVVSLCQRRRSWPQQGALSHPPTFLGHLGGPRRTSSRRSIAKKTPRLNQGRSWASPIGLFVNRKQRQDNSPTLTPTSDLPDLSHLEAWERGSVRRAKFPPGPHPSTGVFTQYNGAGLRWRNRCQTALCLGGWSKLPWTWNVRFLPN